MENTFKGNEQESTVSILPSRFINKGLIGQGGMGSVFRAQDKLLEREVAIKLLSFAGAHEQAVQKRFLQEAKALALIDCPYIVKILGSGLSECGFPYHILEYLEGEPLSELLKKEGRLKASAFYEIMAQVCQGLETAHRAGIIHRDLKPSNLIVSRNHDCQLQVKIIDFGIAQVSKEQGTQSLTQTSQLLGSPAYMSPEQCRGAKVDHLSDIYSLGCIMYESLSGKPPFSADTPMALMYKHMQETTIPVFDGKTDTNLQKLAALVNRCLEKDPCLRPQSAAELLACLHELFEQELSLPRRLPGGFAAERKKPAKTALSISLLLLLCFLGAALWFKQSRNNYVIDSKFNRLTQVQEKRVKELKEKISKCKVELAAGAALSRIKELKTEIVDLLVEFARLEKLHSPEESERVLDEAENYCNGNSNWELESRSKILVARGDIETTDPKESEHKYNQALELIRKSRNSIWTQAEEPILNKLLLHHIYHRVWHKCSEDFKNIQEIWKKYPVSFTHKEIHNRVSRYIFNLPRNPEFADNHEIKEGFDFAADLCRQALDVGDLRSASGCLQGMIAGLRSLPKNSLTYKQAAPNIFELQAQVYKREGNEEAARALLKECQDLKSSN